MTGTGDMRRVHRFIPALKDLCETKLECINRPLPTQRGGLADRAGAAARTRESRTAGSTIERHDAKAMNGRCCSETADAQANHSPTRFQVWPFLLGSTKIYAQIKNKTLPKILNQPAKGIFGVSRSMLSRALRKNICYAWFRSQASYLRIPFGDHPLKLERYRED